MEPVYQKKTQVSASVTDDTYNRVLREAARRGVTVSELVRHYVEEGLSNPIPRELRALHDRISTTESVLRELYEMAVMNWAQVQKDVPKPLPPVPLLWMPGAFEGWKEQLSKRGLVNEKTGKLAYEELEEKYKGAPDYDDPYDMGPEETQQMLRDMWIADGSWTKDEEVSYQEKMKRLAEEKQGRLREGAGLPAKKRPYNRKKKRGPKPKR